MSEREPAERSHDFKLMELMMTEKESCQEAGPLPALRPLRLRQLQGREENRMVNVTINGISLQVEEGTSILDATRTGRHARPHPLLSEGHQ